MKDNSNDNSTVAAILAHEFNHNCFSICKLQLLSNVTATVHCTKTQSIAAEIYMWAVSLNKIREDRVVVYRHHRPFGSHVSGIKEG